jgi:superfamily II DNA helicase RecQ
MNDTRSPSPGSQPPLGTRHRRKRHRSTSKAFHHAPAKSQSRLNATHFDDLTARLKELESLLDLIKQKFTTWQDGARPFQMECMRAQVLHQDVLLHAATGSGKTGVAAGPHLLPSSNGKVTLFVSPLLSLHDEQVSFLSR